MAADGAVERTPADPPPPPPAAQGAPPQEPFAEFAEADFEADRQLYADLPLGLLHPAVIPHGSAAQHPELTAGRTRLLCYFMHRHLEIRLPEIDSLAAAAARGGRVRSGSGAAAATGTAAEAAAAGERPAVVFEQPFGNRPESPFWYAHFDSPAAAEAVGRKTMLAKVLLEVWGEAESLEGLQAAVAAYPAEEKARWGSPDQSFRFVVEAWGCTYSQAEQVELIESMEQCTGLQGPIDLKKAQNRFWLIVAKSNGRGLPLLPPRFYFGREVAAADRSVLTTYSLKTRRYLGPTSMDTEMAFLMANLAQVGRGSLVLDPFVGTGSILIPAAHLGALTLGTDIDIRVIKLGKKDSAGNRVNIWTNFQDYGLPPPLGLLRCDLHTAPFRDGLEEVLDALICDPPYGVRAGGRKSTAKERQIRSRQDYIPSTDPYSVAECLHDLLDAAARLLRLGGRLVYFLPAAPGYYLEEELPRHPALRLVANCEQMLTTRYSRRLIVMDKAAAYDAAVAEAYYAERGPPKMAIDDMHDYIYKKPEQLAAEAGLSLEEHRAAQAARIPRTRGKLI